MLRIYIGSISEQGLDLDEQVDAALLSLLKAVSREGAASFTRPVHVNIHATRAGETVLIDGTAETWVRIPCACCLEPFDLKIETDFSTTAVPEIPSIIETDAKSDIELVADDMNVIAYGGDYIDLSDEIAQQIIMVLPFKPMCRDACKGLCSRCGVDLNKIPCQCPSLEENNPFEVLKALSFPKKQE